MCDRLARVINVRVKFSLRSGSTTHTILIRNFHLFSLTLTQLTMEEMLISITDAAQMCGKSIQTLRRAIKSKKIKVRKKRTPQGFNYLVEKESVLSFYGLKEPKSFRDIPIEQGIDEAAIHASHGVHDAPVTSEGVHSEGLPVDTVDARDTVHARAEELAKMHDIQVAQAQAAAQAQAVALATTQATTHQMALRLEIHETATIAVQESVKQLDSKLENLVGQYTQERTQLGNLLKEFQDRMLVIENQVRMLQAPKKRWFQMWK